MICYKRSAISTDYLEKPFFPTGINFQADPPHVVVIIDLQEQREVMQKVHRCIEVNTTQDDFFFIFFISN